VTNTGGLIFARIPLSCSITLMKGRQLDQIGLGRKDVYYASCREAGMISSAYNVSAWCGQDY
jgi:hypothetical protein